MTSAPSTSVPTAAPTTANASDAALVTRLYQLASELAHQGSCDAAELARIDAVVYARLARTYAGDAPRAGRLDS